jgi:hypothetical protein
MVEPKYYNTAGHPRIGSTTSAPKNNLPPAAQEFDQLFDNGESILKTLDLSTAHRINYPTDLMTDQPLSPAAQAILDAYGDFEAANTDAMAAALRAAADQVDWESGDPKFLVLAIAAELEGYK